MHGEGFFIQALIYLAAAVISVPLAKRLGLGSVLGYLLAGIIIGPYLLGLVGEEGTDVMHFAEFGVVMMLFLIGLELRPSLLWQMRRSIFGLGGLQVVVTAIVIGAIALFFEMNLYQSLTIGLIFALSSTAIVLQTLNEKGLMKTEAGQSSFSVLLFQDIAVIPILAILPLMAGQVDLGVVVHNVPHGSESHGVSALPGWQQLLIILGLVSFIILTGRFLSRYLFRFIAGTGLREIFTATALLLVIAIAVGMEQVGLSPALGTFIAGVVLADSEYRHELESDIEPFKGLLLGLFFIAVGASIDFQILGSEPGTIAGLLGILILVKFVILYILSRVFRLKGGQEMLFTFSLAQAGEFAFVLISFSSQNAILDDQTSGILLIVVALSMLLTPLLLIINEKLVQPRFERSENEQEADDIDESENEVIIAGYGRFGVVLGRFLKANRIRATILDNNPVNIDMLRKFGHKVFYGDATRPDLLEIAGIEKAKILIIALGDRQKINDLTSYVQKNYPHVKIYARALHVRHEFQLKDAGVSGFRRESYDSALELGIKAICALGFNRFQANRAARSFRYHDEIIMNEMFKIWKSEESQKKYINEARRFSEQLESILLAEQENAIHESDHAWDVDSLREEVREIYLEQQKKK